MLLLANICKRHWAKKYARFSHIFLKSILQICWLSCQCVYSLCPLSFGIFFFFFGIVFCIQKEQKEFVSHTFLCWKFIKKFVANTFKNWCMSVQMHLYLKYIFCMLLLIRHWQKMFFLLIYFTDESSFGCHVREASNAWRVYHTSGWWWRQFLCHWVVSSKYFDLITIMKWLVFGI